MTPKAAILDLAARPDGCLAPSSEAIDALLNAGLITIKWVDDGFVIARAVRAARKHDRALNWRWYRRRRETEERIAP